MEDFYVVYDATPAEKNLNYLQMGIARSVDQFEFEQGATENVDEEVEIDNPIPEDFVPEGEQEDGQGGGSAMVILLVVVSIIAATSGAVYCIKKKRDQGEDTLIYDSKDRMKSALSDTSLDTPMNASVQN